MKHILLSCLLLLALCATALAAPVEKQTFRVVAPEGWTVTTVPDVSEGVVLVAPDKSVSVTIVTAASGTMTPEQLAADYEQKLHAARVAQNGNYYGTGHAPDAGLSVARMAAHITYLSETSLHEKFGRRLQNRETKTFGFDADFQVES